MKRKQYLLDASVPPLTPGSTATQEHRQHGNHRQKTLSCTPLPRAHHEHP